jgi:hypothetical protein
MKCSEFRARLRSCRHSEIHIPAVEKAPGRLTTILGPPLANALSTLTTTHAISRRELVRRAVMAVASYPLAQFQLSRPVRGMPTPLRVGVVPPSQSPDASVRALGIQLGADEARHAAALFGGSIEVVEVGADSMRGQRLSVVIGGDDTSSCVRIADAARSEGVLFLNVGCASDSLRANECRSEMFHVVPSEAMYRDALLGARATPASQALAWHPSLERFGADTLNQRFHARFTRPMIADAWLGWFAVKVAWETSLRTKSVDGKTLIRSLQDDRTQFDGHKGRPLSFRRWDHQLRQPLYIAENRGGGLEVVAEEPAVGASDESSRDALDRMGTSAAHSTCRLSP